MAEEVEKKTPDLQKEELLVKKELPKKKSPLGAVFGVLALAVVGLVAFFTVNLLNSPARVKEQAMPAQQIFSDYHKAITKISDHILDDSEVSGAEDLEREVKKAEGFVKDAKGAKEQLETMISNMSVSQLKEYKASLEKYNALASEFIQAEQESVDLYSAYVSPLKKYEDLSVELSGVSQYLYNNPSKYVEMLEEFKNEESKILDTFKSAKASDLYKDMHENYIKQTENEIQFLDDMVKAAENRDVDEIAAAQKTYGEQNQKLSDDGERAEDAYKEKFEDKTDELEDLEEEISDLYSSLKAKFKF